MKRTALFFFLLGCLSGFSQSSGTLVYQHSDSSIALKWYTQALTYPGGVHVFRQEQDKSWTQLTATPIQLGDAAIPENHPNATLQEMAAFMKSPNAPIEGALLLNLLAMSFQENDFARFLGICFEDNTRDLQFPIRYKILEPSSNKLIAQSDWIPKVPANENIAPLHLKQKRKKLQFYLAPDYSKYFGASVLRKFKNEPQFDTITPLPIFFDQVQLDTLKPFFEEDLPGKKRVSVEYKILLHDYFGGTTTLPEQVIQLEPIDPPRPCYNFAVGQDQQVLRFRWNHPESLSNTQEVALQMSPNYEGPFRDVQSVSAERDSLKLAPPRAGDLYFRLATREKGGSESFSNIALASIEDMVPPTTPRALEYTENEHDIILQWNAVATPDLAGYRVFRSTDRGRSFSPLNASLISNPHWEEHFPLTTKGRVGYCVQAVDSSWNYSIPTDTLWVTLPDVTPPSAPLLKKVVRTTTGDSLTVSYVVGKEPDLARISCWIQPEHGDPSLLQRWSPTQKEVKIPLGEREPFTCWLTAQDSTGNESEPSKSVAVAGFKQPSSSHSSETIQLKAKEKKHWTIVQWETLSDATPSQWVLFTKNGREWHPWKTLETHKKLKLATSELQGITLQLRGYEENDTMHYSNVLMF